MFNPDFLEPELPLLLGPILATFQYWLSRTRSLLEHESIDFLDQQQQLELLGQVQQTLPNITAARSLYHATSGQVGIEASLLETWHQLVSDCWQVVARFRRDQAGELPEAF